MDNLTHSLTGLLMSKAGLDRFHARATLTLVLAANVPDIDILAITRGQLSYFQAHRGITHALVMSPVMALLPVLVALAVSRSTRGWLPLWLISLAGVASHLLFDWTNAYGIRLLLPFSEQFFRLDLNNLIELWIWTVFFLAWLAPMLSRLLSSEMGARGSHGRGWAIFALAFVLVFEAGKALSHARAIDVLNSRVYQDGPPVRVAAFPNTLANPFEWAGWVERPGFVVHFPSLNVLGDFDPTAGVTISKAEPGPAIDSARTAPEIQAFLKFAQFPLWSVAPAPEPEGALIVALRDWRFPFTAAAIVDGRDRVIASSFHY